MRRLRHPALIICLGLALLLLVAAPLAAQDAAAFASLRDAQPVVANAGDMRSWDGQYTDPGAVFYHDGQFHMFRNGFIGWPNTVQIGYLTSPDGLAWTEVSEDPVLTTAEVPYAEIAALASSGLVLDDGTWVLYFYTWNARSGANAPGAIGRATASDPAGPWTPDPQPVLTPGAAGAWDDQQVSAPHVSRTDDGYVMYYSGYNTTQGNRGNRIGLATSNDGISWTKYDDPATTEAAFADSDPIFSSVVDGTFAHQPNILATPDGWVLVYRQSLPGGRGMSVHCATSDDGIAWDAGAGSTLFSTDMAPNGAAFWWTRALHAEDTTYLYVEINHRVGTSIFVTTHTGALEC